MAVRYKPEVHDFIRTHLDQFTIQEMAEEANRRFGTDFNYNKMKGYYQNHKLKTGKRQTIRSKLWPEDVVEVLLSNYKGRTYAEMLEVLREETGRERVYTGTAQTLLPQPQAQQRSYRTV